MQFHEFQKHTRGTSMRVNLRKDTSSAHIDSSPEDDDAVNYVCFEDTDTIIF